MRSLILSLLRNGISLKWSNAGEEIESCFYYTTGTQRMLLEYIPLNHYIILELILDLVLNINRPFCGVFPINFWRQNHPDIGQANVTVRPGDLIGTDKEDKINVM